jgi:hypothetical protein
MTVDMVDGFGDCNLHLFLGDDDNASLYLLTN